VLRDLATDKETWRLRSGWQAYSFTSDGKQILVGFDGAGGGEVVFGRLDAASGAQLWSFRISTPLGVTATSISADGGRVAIASGMYRTDGQGSIWLEVWDTKREMRLWKTEVPEEVPEGARIKMPGQ
jgi:hypothetical protein